MAFSWCTQADLERALGGADVLRQLADPNRTGTADSTTVTKLIEYASDELASYVQIAVDMPTLVTAPYPSLLVQKTADVAAFHAWSRGGRGQAMPDNVQRGYDAAIGWADRVGQRRATLGVTPRKASGQAITQVDADPDLTGVSRASLRGFI